MTHYDAEKFTSNRVDCVKPAWPLFRLETLGSLIESYESQHVPELSGDPIHTLKSLMEEHGLKQADMKEIGSQRVVSEVLSGMRSLNSRQIKALSERFSVSPAVFI